MTELCLDILIMTDLGVFKLYFLKLIHRWGDKIQAQFVMSLNINSFGPITTEVTTGQQLA